MEKLGAKVTYVGVDQYGWVSPADIEQAIIGETILISVMHAQTTTFAFETNESILDLKEGRSTGYIYTRYGNPNYTMVKEKIAFLEDAESGLDYSNRKQ